MISEAITTVAEYIAGLGLDVAKEHVQGKLDEKKLRSALTSYIEIHVPDTRNEISRFT